MVFDNGWPLIRADAGSLFSSSVIVSAVRLELNLVEPIG